MSLVRRVLLALSTNAWLRERATKSAVVGRSVRRFMPGERLEDALEAARAQQSGGVTTILTSLGENLTHPQQAEAVASHYREVIDRVHALGLDAQVSVKPTQLGLDIDRRVCADHLCALAERATARGQLIWVDMESSQYVDSTIELFTKACGHGRVGLAVQAYLHRTAADLDRVLSVAAGIRLVKGAYLEAPSVALQTKADIDESYYRLGARLLTAAAAGGPHLHVATHDRQLVERLDALAAAEHVPGTAYEYAMLYGIQRPLQQHLTVLGRRVRVLIAYGDNWFPWFMRRLAERPANITLLARNFFGS